MTDSVRNGRVIRSNVRVTVEDGVIISEERYEVDVTDEAVAYDLSVKTRRTLDDVRTIRDAKTLTDDQVVDAVKALARILVDTLDQGMMTPDDPRLPGDPLRPMAQRLVEPGTVRPRRS